MVHPTSSLAKGACSLILVILLLAAVPAKAISAAIAAPASGPEESSQTQETAASIVFVVDVSSSMADEVDELKKSFREFIEALEPGQMVALVTFGGSPQMRFEGVIGERNQKEKLLKVCNEFSCTEEYTNIPFGLYRGLKQLLDFHKKKPNGIHNLVMFSDGKDHPPPNTPIDTYDDARELLSRFPKESMGKDWYITYVSLGPEPDLELRDFLAGLWQTPSNDEGKEVPEAKPPIIQPPPTFTEPFVIGVVRIQPGGKVATDRDNVIDLGELSPLEETRVDIPLRVTPIMGKVAGASISVKPVLTGVTSGLRLMPKIVPTEIRCAEHETIKTLALSIVGHANTALCGVLKFESTGKNISVINPPSLMFAFSEPPAVVPVCFKVRPKAVSDYEPRSWLAFTDLQPGSGKGVTFVLEPDHLPEGKKLEIRATPEILLPEGLSIRTEVETKGLFSEKKAFVTVSVDADPGAKLEAGGQWKGKLRLSSPIVGVSFSENPILLRVSTQKPPSLWGRLRNAFQEDAGESGDEAGGGISWSLIGAILAAPVSVIGMVLGLRYLRFRIYESRFVPPEGWLVTLEKPVGAEVENVNLKELSEKLGKSTILIGRDPSCDIVLAHESVGKRHAEIRSKREGTPAPVYIRSLNLNDMRINNYLSDGEVKLQDRDIIDIAGFQFIYSNSYLKQVVVRYKDGDVKYGVPLSWNIEEQGFVLQPEGESSDDLRVYISFKDLKGVFFVKTFDREIARKIRTAGMFAKKDHIVVEFLDGEKMEGHTLREYDSRSPRFFVVPKPGDDKNDNNVCVLVERTATRRVEILKHPKAKRPTANISKKA